MHPRPDRRPGRRRPEKGGALVEFAFIAPVLLTLVLGVMDFGWILNTQAGLRQADRTVTREVTLGNFGSSSTCTLVGVSTAPTATKQVMCRAKSLVGGDASEIRVKIWYPGGVGYAQRESAVICLQRPMPSLSGMFSMFTSGRFITAKADMRIEASDATGAPAAAEETAPTGGSWAFCTAS